MLMPCGFDAARDGATSGCAAAPRDPDWVDELRAVREGEVYALDGSAYFSRPGPARRRRHRAAGRAVRPGDFGDEVPRPEPGCRSVRARAPRLTRSGRALEPFHAAFNCLWCGRPHQTRTDDDLEGWALLCPDCVGRAQDNEFLRFRLREGAAPPRGGRWPSVASRRHRRQRPTRRRDARLLRARAPASTTTGTCGAAATATASLADVAWHADLDTATLWLDRLPISGEIVELAAGTGWWSPLLAQKGRAVALRRNRGAARSCARPAARPRARARTSTCATRGPSRTARSTRSSAASG